MEPFEKHAGTGGLWGAFSVCFCFVVIAQEHSPIGENPEQSLCKQSSVTEQPESNLCLHLHSVSGSGEKCFWDNRARQRLP